MCSFSSSLLSDVLAFSAASFAAFLMGGGVGETLFCPHLLTDIKQRFFKEAFHRSTVRTSTVKHFRHHLQAPTF